MLCCTLLAACGESPTESTSLAATLELVGASQSDTIGTELGQVLQVWVRDGAGKPIPDALVSFSAINADGIESPFQPYAIRLVTYNFLGRAAQPYLEVATSATGAAATFVELGNFPGVAEIVVRQRELNLVDTARFEVRPGRGVGFVALTADTTITVGEAFRPGATLVDRLGNVVDSDPTFVPLTPNILDFAADELVGVTAGRAVLRIVGVDFTFDAYVTVMSPGSFAYQRIDGADMTVVLSSTNGLDQRELYRKAGAGNSFWPRPAWSPDGQYLAYNDDGWLVVDDLTGVRDSIAGGLDLRGHISWTSQGPWVYFQRPDTVWRVRPGGGSQERVVTGEGGGISPDGSALLYEAGGEWRVLDVATGASVELGAMAGEMRFPAWSPDGSTIVAHRHQRGEDHVYSWDGMVSVFRVWDADGGAPGSGLAWAPDGATYLVPTNSSGWWLGEKETGRYYRVLHWLSHNHFPAWSGQPLP